jgi:hypothetical protein
MIDKENDDEVEAECWLNLISRREKRRLSGREGSEVDNKESLLGDVLEAEST